MEPNLSASDFLNEDGHGSRDLDIIADDMENLRQLHRDFIAVMDKAVALDDVDPDEALHIEQVFGDMLHKRARKLEAEGGEWPDMPKSDRLRKWEKGE